MSLGTRKDKKQIQLRLPQELLAHIDAIAVELEISRERAIRLALAGSDVSTLARGFARLAHLE